MIEYLRNLLVEFESLEGDLGAPAATPASEHLFEVREDDDPSKQPLSEERAQLFHRTTAKLLFVCNRPRRDIQLPISFLA